MRLYNHTGPTLSFLLYFVFISLYFYFEPYVPIKIQCTRISLFGLISAESRWALVWSQGVVSASPLLTYHDTTMSMKSINRFLYGPTPEEKVRAWQQKLRTEQRQLDKEIRQVRFPLLTRHVHDSLELIAYSSTQQPTRPASR